MSPAAASPALQRVLRELPAALPVATIDRLWLFPPRDLGGRESGLVVLSLRGEGGAGQRRVVTLHYEAERGPKGDLHVEQTMAEQGSAPAERIPRLIEGVIARLGAPDEDPRAESIECDPARWDAFLASLGDAQVDPANGE